jgi:putative membrane protein
MCEPHQRALLFLQLITPLSIPHPFSVRRKSIMMSAIIGFIITLLIAALVIWIVSKLGLGMEVDGFGSAIMAALVIALVTWIVMWILGLLGISFGTGWLGAIVALIVSAVVLMISDKFLSGMKVNGFVGALIAAVAIGVVQWLLAWIIGIFV